MAIRRDIHPICDNCWDEIVGIDRWKIKDLHHFFTFDRHAPCCWCEHPSHGQFWRATRNAAPCQGLFGFHIEQNQVIDLDEIKQHYPDDSEIKELVSIAKNLQAEVASLLQERTVNDNDSIGSDKRQISHRKRRT